MCEDIEYKGIPGNGNTNDVYFIEKKWNIDRNWRKNTLNA